MLDGEIHRRLRGDPRYAAVQLLPGIVPVFAPVLVTEIGDISRFASPEKLCSWAELTPLHRELDTTVPRGSISEQGSRLAPWRSNTCGTTSSRVDGNAPGVKGPPVGA